ncbi:MAG: VOC family protein [Candidatus Scalindua sp. AMX11]|nr:MAG: VOC family protein [Candidatus Scalindua sp.]NOG83180.1 VOC family protein [Planctomycetota bacterium]RZV77546.1 MAG: VOC family protein [Candidatus Scalindua sp. SCAELEC01]TDE64574.1 MAG: VOC family protein [Candidatus Scalindua sp. AMX11]
MERPLHIKNSNTILYCENWQQTMEFYRDKLKLSINYESNWFVEFKLTDTAHVSIANESRATIKSGKGAGITLTFEVEDINQTWQYMKNNGISLDPIKDKWGSSVFYFRDPEGHRIEVWSTK